MTFYPWGAIALGAALVCVAFAWALAGTGATDNEHTHPGVDLDTELRALLEQERKR